MTIGAPRLPPLPRIVPRGGGGPATQLRESGGPTTLSIVSVADGEFLKRVGSTVDGATATDLGAIAQAALVPPLVGTTTKDWMYSQVNASGMATQGFVQNIIYWALVFAAQDMTFTHFVTQLTQLAGTSKYKLGIWSHDPTDGQPLNLLWKGNEIDAGTGAGQTGKKAQAFSADGTWQGAAGSFRNGSDQLFMARGSALWTSALFSGTAQVRSVVAAGLRALGADTAGSAVLTGLQAARTYGNDYPADTSSLTITEYDTQLPFLGLRRTGV